MGCGVIGRSGVVWCGGVWCDRMAVVWWGGVLVG